MLRRIVFVELRRLDRGCLTPSLDQRPIGSDIELEYVTKLGCFGRNLDLALESAVFNIFTGKLRNSRGGRDHGIVVAELQRTEALSNRLTRAALRIEEEQEDPALLKRNRLAIGNNRLRRLDPGLMRESNPIAHSSKNRDSAEDN